MTKVLPLPAFMESRDQYALYDDFTSPPPLSIIQNVPADLDAGGDLAATAVFAPGVPHQLHAVYITGQTNSAGVDNSNTSLWVVSDAVGERFNSTYSATTVFPVALTPTALTEVATTDGSVPATGYATLAITNGATANTPVTLVNFQYFDYGSYPNQNWKIIASDNGFAKFADGVKGVVTLYPSDESSVADNDEIYMVSKVELFKLADDKPLVYECDITLTEHSTDQANVMFGVMDGVAADSLQDDGAGPKASYSGAVIYKVDGGTNWVCESSDSTTQTTNTSGTARVSGTQTRLRIQIQPVTSTVCTVTYFVDDAQLQDNTTTALISHDITFTNATEMAIVLAVKNGDTSDQETLAVDRVIAAQLR